MRLAFDSRPGGGTCATVSLQGNGGRLVTAPGGRLRDGDRGVRSRPSLKLSTSSRGRFESVITRLTRARGAIERGGRLPNLAVIRHDPHLAGMIDVERRGMRLGDGVGGDAMLEVQSIHPNEGDVQVEILDRPLGDMAHQLVGPRAQGPAR